MIVEFLYCEDCPSHPEGLKLLEDTLRELGVDAGCIVVRKITTDEEAARQKFPGSPTIRINGADIDPASDKGFHALTCRVYTRTDGRFSPLPDPERLRQAVRTALDKEREQTSGS